MRPQHPQGQIRPKISTMPRQKTEAAAYLDIYKLVTEKKRLQQELETLEQRRDRIQQRLEVLGTQIAQLEESAHQLRDANPAEVQSPAQVVRKSETNSSNTFDMEFLEY